jgi:hypothetical protein
MIVSAAWGTMLGCFGAALAMFVAHADRTPFWVIPPPVAALLSFPALLPFAGPGAVALSIPLTLLLRGIARSIGKRFLLLHGAILGTPLGLANLYFTNLLWSFERDPWTWRWIISAAGGGLGLGLGVSAGILYGEPKEGRP